MKKIFDCEDEPNDNMEEPCVCDCGKWFDLKDGHRSLNSEKIICRACLKNEADDILEPDEECN